MKPITLREFLQVLAMAIVCIAGVFATALLIGVVLTRTAHAHDMDRPDLDGWYASLINQWGGDCCDRKDCKPLKFGNKGDPGVDAWLGTDEDGQRTYQFRARREVFPHANGEIVNLPMSHRAYQWVLPAHMEKRIAVNQYGSQVLVACADFTPTAYRVAPTLYCFVPPDLED